MTVFAARPLDHKTTAMLASMGCRIIPADPNRPIEEQVSRLDPDFVILGDTDIESPTSAAQAMFNLIDMHVRSDAGFIKRANEMNLSSPLEGLVIGLVGFGEVGKHLRDLAHEHLMAVAVYSSHIADEGADAHGVRRMPDVVTLATMSDVIAVQENLRPDTVGLLKEEFFAAMKPGAILVNGSHPSVFEENALRNYLEGRDMRPADAGKFNDDRMDINVPK